MPDTTTARLFFPDEKLYFQPTLEGLPMDAGVLDGIAVHEVKRLIANFDNETENEMAIQLIYSDGLCNSCAGQVIFAILGKRGGEIKILWKNKHLAFDEDGTTDIWATRLIRKDNFPQLVLKYSGLACSGCSHKWVTIVRWNGKEFTEIWSHEIEKYDHGGHTENAHRYVANVDFTRNDRPAKEIRVNSIYVTFPTAVEQRTQTAVTEEFAWSEKEQRYLVMRKREYKYEKGEACDFSWEQGRKDYRQCYKVEPRR